jgi:SAM-dependent methyltransferase
MLARLILAIMRKSAWARRRMFRLFFQSVARWTRKAEWWTCMNYGYAELNDGAAPIPLDAADEPERYCLQLYHHVASGAEIAGRDVLEVSSGRGGGAVYMRHYLEPKSVTGIDISANAVAFCRRVHEAPGLRFLEGDAEDIPLLDASLDVVVNVEASFCYGSIDGFFSEVARVLRPGGNFLYADLRLTEEVDDLLESLRRCDLELLKAEDITGNVIRALEADNARRLSAIQRHVPFFLQGIMKVFVGTQGSRMPDFLSSGRMRYLNFVLRKPATARADKQREMAACRSEVVSPAGAGLATAARVAPVAGVVVPGQL